MIPAVAGLVGAVAGAALVHFRWVHDRKDAQQGPYEEKRRDAYDGLWRVIEQAHVAARRGTPQSRADERQFTADLNAFAMVNGVYIDDADRQLAHAYITSVLRFLANLEAADRPEYREMAASTASFPSDFGPAVAELSQEGRHIEELRVELRSRVRAVLKGGPSGGAGEHTTNVADQLDP